MVLYANPISQNVINELKRKVTYMSLSVCAKWGLSIISWMFRLMTLVAIHQGEVRGVSKGGKAAWMGRRGHGQGGRAAAMPWVDLTSVTLMAFVFAAKPDVSESQFHTPQSEVQHRGSHTTTYTWYKTRIWKHSLREKERKRERVRQCEPGPSIYKAL